ncbi:hypothetical protein [Hymenobacter convexus]|uniref:hypothetical protein n=1 Tax=Hymenobacter sp. CA1UV-4 TaxID=3063782 RepID=UPI002712B0E9|nr:hypothetical protein [Hymenobacter sp. CA1UV-4]MDO7851593.1 hypothetical protein [Hymenobacter sp. CA1UV-4]
MTERQKFLHLLAAVIEDLPTSAIDTAVRAGYEATTTMLANVRMGRVMNLPHLVKLIEVGLPEFEIPESLRPAAPAPAGVPLFR